MAQFITDNIFVPLNMDESQIMGYADTITNIITVYDKAGKIHKMEQMDADDCFGNAVQTAFDLYKFLSKYKDKIKFNIKQWE